MMNPAIPGQIIVANSGAVDFETNPVFNLIVQATDNGTNGAGANTPLSSTDVVTINLTNVNEQIAFTSPQPPFSVPENSPAGTLAGTIGTTDPDNEVIPNLQGQSFNITGGNTNGAFGIDAQGHITITNPSAPSTFVQAQTILSLGGYCNRLTGVPSTSASTTITINVINENDPADRRNAEFQRSRACCRRNHGEELSRQPIRMFQRPDADLCHYRRKHKRCILTSIRSPGKLPSPIQD